MYRVQLERAAEKDLRRLTAEVHRRVVASIVALGVNPRPSGARKLHGGDGEWRIRVGDYRIIYAIADTIRGRTNRDRTSIGRSGDGGRWFRPVILPPCASVV